jgi:tyrosyl-tRNA synthetase
VGGSDQLGNIVTGYELIRKGSKKAIFGLLTPLVTNEVGDKYGKSTGLPIWLNRDKLSAFDFYQFFFRLPDSEVGKFLNLFTLFSDDETEQIMQKFLKNTTSQYAQKILAETMTLLVHGEDGLNLAKKTTTALYEQDTESIGKLSHEEMQEVFGKSALSTIVFLDPGETTVLDLALKANCFPNERDAIRIISAGGFYINYKQVTSPSQEIKDEHILANNTSLLRVGKRRFYIVKWH